MQAQRANTLDGFLEELPELPSGYFSFPVDDFFDNYVEELGQRGLQNAPSSALGKADLGQYDSLRLRQDQAFGSGTKTPMDSAMSLDLPLIPDADLTYATQPVLSIPDTANSTVNVAGAESGSEVLGTNGKRAATSTAQPEAHQATQGNSRPRRTVAQPEYNGEAEGFDSDDSDHKHTKSARGAAKTKRNAKQQVQNKQAQQRYRERRKQRFTEMEHAIDGLNSQVQHMHSVQSQNSMLQAKREELERALRAKEQELQQLRAQVQNGRGGEPPEVEDSSPEQRRQTEEANLRDCQAKAAEHVQALRDFIEQHDLCSASPTGEDADPAVMQRLAEMVGQGCSTSQNAMRAEGVKVLRLMGQDVAHLSRINCLRQCNKWTKVLEKLRLTDIQREQLLLMRKNHLRNLRQVYEARQQLNMRAMSLMLPTEKAGGKDLDGKMACMSLRGYSNCAAQSVELDEILNSIRENLRLEQKHVMEMNFVTMHRLMSPLQAALFLVEVHPAHCDALALANILASQLEGSHKGSGTSRELHGADSGHSSGSPVSSSDNKSESCRLLKVDLDRHESG